VCRGGLERWEDTAQGVRFRTRQLPQPRFAQVAGITSDKFVPKRYHIESRANPTAILALALLLELRATSSTVR